MKSGLFISPWFTLLYLTKKKHISLLKTAPGSAGIGAAAHSWTRVPRQGAPPLIKAPQAHYYYSGRATGKGDVLVFFYRSPCSTGAFISRWEGREKLRWGCDLTKNTGPLHAPGGAEPVECVCIGTAEVKILLSTHPDFTACPHFPVVVSFIQPDHKLLLTIMVLILISFMPVRSRYEHLSYWAIITSVGY